MAAASSSFMIVVERCNLVVPLSLTSCLRCRRRRRRRSWSSSSKALILSPRLPSPSQSSYSDLTLRLVFDGSSSIPRRPMSLLNNNNNNKHHPMIIKAAVDHDHVEEEDQEASPEEEDVDKDSKLSMKEYSSSESQQKASQLKKRVVFGLGIGISVGGVVLAGGWVFTVALAAAVLVGAREYFELVRSRGITAGMTPPPRYVSRVCSVICALMPILTLYFGHIDVSVTSAAFVVAMALLLQRGNPRFAQLSTAIFGLFYCGYLPCFWVKLRCGLAAPALHTGVASTWPILLGGRTHWTVGLVATLISISSIIAADTFAFLGGKAFGRTPLTNISPKKTWEGAVAGLGGCIATSILLSKIFIWPITLPSSIAFGFLNFFGSLFGDLIESMIKRDAGVKDSGSLIPGHGGILDRVDSYIFTGALAYSFVKTFLPLYGV